MVMLWLKWDNVDCAATIQRPHYDLSFQHKATGWAKGNSGTISKRLSGGIVAEVKRFS